MPTQKSLKSHFIHSSNYNSNHNPISNHNSNSYPIPNFNWVTPLKNTNNDVNTDDKTVNIVKAFDVGLINILMLPSSRQMMASLIPWPTTDCCYEGKKSMFSIVIFNHILHYLFITLFFLLCSTLLRLRHNDWPIPL